jgi:hypothetical protein
LREISSFKSIYKYNSKPFVLLYRALLISPFVGSALIVSILFQMINNEGYHIVFISITTLASFIPAIIILSMLVIKFVRWFKSKHDYIMFSYTIAIAAILINAVFLILNLPTELFDYSIVREPVTVQDRINSVGIPNQYFQKPYVYSSFFSFILTWVATSILLHYYSRKVGNATYWLLVAVPLIYFLAQYPQIFNYIFSNVRDTDPILYARISTIIFGLTKAAGGIFFAIGFWVVGKSINNKQIKNYLRFTGYGILLLFIATQANSVIISPYPPFGIIAISSMTLASLLTFVGLYFTALSISRETTLRTEIDKKLIQLAFIKKMGTAQLEMDLYREVLPILERSSEEDNIPTSLETEDVKLYVKEALRALKKTNSH